METKFIVNTIDQAYHLVFQDNQEVRYIVIL